MRPTLYLVAAGLLATVGGAVARQCEHGPSRSGMSLSTLDKDYLKETAQSNLEEVQFEPVVETHAGSGEVKQFGRRMKQDHGKANADLKRLAARVGYALPKDVSEDQKALMARLSKFQGAKFDAAYKQEMIRDHTEDIAKTRREISLGRNPQVKASAQKNLALLQGHLQMSHALGTGAR